MQTVLRLINQFIPNNYKLFLSLDKKNRTFDGYVIINGYLKSGYNDILLHSKELNIISVSLNDNPANYSFENNDTLHINNSNICEGNYTITIKYGGKITDSMHGIYPCYYENDGIKKELLATQFESHHAREVFPCIDEPEAKATFDVTLNTDNNVIVLGNMPIKNQIINDNRQITTFETTPIMSTYLLAWVVGELHKKTAYTKSGVEVNVWATPAQPENNLDFALDIATRSIDFYDEYFDTPYPLPKCDNVALPDFSSGAMENWGLLTYREIALLSDPESTSVSNKHYIATVIAHEISHQWFGNLVTMKWWNDLWLNESFASLVEYSAIDAIEPEWNIWLDFFSYESIFALQRDSLNGVQPVQVDVSHPDEISSLFDGAIVYAKGAHLMKMLQRYIGNKSFQVGLKNYFKTYAYKNTEADDLWNAFSHESGKDIASFMKAWITQPGFPVLHVSRCDNQILLSQERLTNKQGNKSNSLWPITLNSNYSEMPELFHTRSLNVSVNNNFPIRFNIGNDAHFITHYSHELLKSIITQIKSNKLSMIDRLQLLNEQSLLARSGIISSSELIPLLHSYSKESTEAVWNIIAMTINELKKFVENDINSENKFKKFVKSLAFEQFNKLGWTPSPNETETTTKLRSTIISLMIYSEDKDVIKTATDLFDIDYLDKLDPELRSIIISTVVRNNNDSKLINSLFENYKKTTSSQLKQDICLGLTASRNETIINNILKTIKNTSIIRTQDTTRWIIFLARNKYSKQQTWQWVRDNWLWIEENFGGDKSYDDYPRYMASSLSTKVQLDEYINFFTPLISVPSLSRVINIGIGEIKNRVDLIKRDSEIVQKTLLNF